MVVYHILQGEVIWQMHDSCFRHMSAKLYLHPCQVSRQQQKKLNKRNYDLKVIVERKKNELCAFEKILIAMHSNSSGCCGTR